ncbi:MAG: putative zinc-binding protein [Candidatus Bathyarchaeota archaeon]|jgi:uncharacterized metal-binding protein|nr:putative zinc-binding protein [Candidatus Bathyarchaeota archaeon]
MNIRPKIGVVSCSGECCSLGSVSRIATRTILEDLKAGETVTICLPLFLAGDSGEREFAKVFPTVAVDGCHKLCATKAIEKYSGRTATSVDVEGLLEEWGAEPPVSRREMDRSDLAIVRRVAMEIAKRVEGIQGGTYG